MSIEDLSALTGLSIEDIQAVEEGSKTLALRDMHRLSNYLNISPADFLLAIHA